MKKFTLFALSFLMVTGAIAQPDASFKGDNPSALPKSQGWIQSGGVVTLWDNGLPDGINGYSNAVAAVFGARRTLLDDFTVGAGEIWDVENFTWNHVWNSFPAGSGTGEEIQFVADAAGSPDLGTVIAVATVNTYTEIGTGNVFFSRPEAESFAEFDPINLTEGTYWFEHTVVGPDNNFHLTAAQQGTECWVNYDDLGGLNSCFTQFGQFEDLSWRLGGVVVPVELQSIEIE